MSRLPKAPTAASRVSARKSGGDDACSWAVFVDGREKWSGMTRSEAQWRKGREIAALEEGKR